MTKIYRMMKGNSWFYTGTFEEAKEVFGPGFERNIYECRIIAPRTKRTVVDAANGRFDEVVLVWSPAI